jgi:excisionase family DNA binding protein
LTTHRTRTTQAKLRWRKSASLRATLQVEEAAAIAGCGSDSIRRLIKEGKVPHIMFGRCIKIPTDAFLRWLDSCGVAA